MKIIFLDMDGVVNSICKGGMQIELPFKNRNGEYRYGCYYDPKVIPTFVKLLNYCRKTGVKIVISSSWRAMGDAEEFNNYYETYFHIDRFSKIENLHRNLVIGRTVSNFSDRSEQIQEFLSTKPDIKEFVIIDDDYFNFRKTFPLYNFIRINPKKGLQNYHLLLMKLSFKWQEFLNKFRRGD